MLTYSVAIRTLGNGRDSFRRELENIASQTIQPDKVLIYIADGHPRPDFQIGQEEYVWVEKGMMVQRLRSYDEIESDCILMLDDDVELQPDSVERLLEFLENNNADCIGADTFETHKLPLSKKICAAVTNLVFPHSSGTWAFKIKKNGSFSYNRNPKRDFYWSQSCAGNAMLWRKSTYEKLHFEDELWLDEFPFAYNDDMLESYKVYKNGFKLGVVYRSGITHTDTKAASNAYRGDPHWLKTRTEIQLIIWWRTCFKPGDTDATTRICTFILFACKSLWMLLGCTALSVIKMNGFWLKSYVNGLKAGCTFVQSDKFKALRPYTILKLNNRI